MCTKKGEQIAETQGDETALVTFTTGTTGIPKAARRTHAYLNAQFNALQPLITSAHIEVDMPMLPIVLFLNLALGRTSVIADFKPSKPAGFAAGKVVDQIIAHGVQGLTASPYYITSISNYLLSSGTKPAQVKQVISGGAPVFPDDAAIMQLAFPNSGVHIVYGSTEAEPISSITAADLVSNHADISKGLCVGTVDSSATVCIIQIKPGAITGNEFASLKLEDEQVGEICVSGDHVLSEYLDNPEATALNKINVNGTIWHRTGDAGCIRSGKLFLLGRCAQIIQFEDHVFYPFLIESLIKNHTRGMMGTMLNAGTPLVVIESGDQTVLSKLKEDLYASQPVFNRLRYMALQNIPRDPRHHSRIDYAKLKELVNQSSES